MVRKLSDTYRKEGWFSIDVRGWEDVVDLIYEHVPPIASQYYPQVFGKDITILTRALVGHLREIKQADLLDSNISDFKPENTSEKSPVYNNPSYGSNIEGANITADEAKVVHEAVYLIHQSLFVPSQSGQSSGRPTIESIRNAVGGICDKYSDSASDPDEESS